MSVAESEERSGENDAGERHQEYGQNLSVTEKSQHAASLFQGISKLHSERRRKHPIKDDSLGRKSHEKYIIVDLEETIQTVIREIIEFNQLVDTLRTEIDIHDAELQKAQNTGFQSFCNVGNKVCNYLAYFADIMLKKDDNSSNPE